MPDNILKFALFPFLKVAPKSQLAKTNQRFAHFPECQSAAQQLEELLWLVAHGEKDRAESLILLHPELLLCEGTTLDRSERPLGGTPLQIAFGAEDFDLYDSEGRKKLGEGMVEMLLRQLRSFGVSEVEIAKQIRKQFPEGWEQEEEKRQKEDSQALNKVWRALRFSNAAEWEAALLEFKNHFKPKKIITTGKHWNAKLLHEAFNMGYYQSFLNSRKNDLFYKQVIGFIQTLAPTNHAMIQTQGLMNLLLQGNKFKRCLTYSDPRKGSYFQPASGLCLGSQCWVDSFKGKPREKALPRGGGSLLQLYLHKQERLKEYCAAAKQTIKNAAKKNHPQPRRLLG